MPLTQLRRDGRALAKLLAQLELRDPLVVAVPRRGMVVGAEVARALDVELDAVLAGKVYADRDAALPIGAVALGGIRVIDEVAAAAQGLRPEAVEAAVVATERRLGERLPIIRSNLALPDLQERTVILVDDAAITGLTLQVALGALTQRRPARVVVATVLCSHQAAGLLSSRTGDLVTLERCSLAEAAASHDAASAAICPPVSDEEVHSLLLGANRPLRYTSGGALELDGLAALEP